MTLEGFLALSVELTAYSETDLRGTGLAERYYDKVRAACTDAVVADLLMAYDKARADPAGLDHGLRHEVFSDDRLGPVARAIIKLWYAGMWYGLPAAWTDAYGAQAAAESSAVTAASYQEGLLWRAIGANPPGAKAPGYGSWAEPPRIEPRYLKGAMT